MIDLRFNDVLKSKDTGIRYLVGHYDIQKDRCWLVELDISKLEIECCSYKSVQLLIKEGALELEEPEVEGLFLESYLSTKDRKVMEKRWKVIQFIENNVEGVHLYNKYYRRLAVKKALKEFDVSRAAIYRWLVIYIQGGKKKYSLAPKFYKCGGKGKRKNNTLKPGRKNEFGETGVLMSKKHEEKMLRVIKRYLERNDQMTTKKAYDILILEEYSTEDKDGRAKPLPRDEVPSYDQFYYFFRKYRNKDYENYQRKRVGEKKFMKNSRELLSNATIESFHPGYRYEADASRPYINLLDSCRKNVIGTPVLYFVVDVFSRVIVGFYIGLDNPSKKTASTALLSCLDDKVELAQKNGVEISSEEWFVSVLPKHLMVDRGEFAGKLGDYVSKELMISVENSASYRGDQKGIVEQLFKLFDDYLIGELPGYSKWNHKKRGEIDYEKYARLTIVELRKIVIQWIVYHNNHQMDKYPAPKEMISDRIDLTPNNIWKWGVKNHGLAISSINVDKARYLLMKETDAVITSKGIRVNGIYYVSDFARTKNWFSKARNEGTTIIQVRFDERDLSYVYYYDHSTSRIIRFEQTEPSQYSYGSISKVEIDALHRIRKETRKANHQKQIERNVQTIEGIRAVVGESERKYDGLNGAKKPQKRDKKFHRMIEREIDSERSYMSVEEQSMREKQQGCKNNEKTGYEDIENLLYGEDQEEEE